MKNPISKEEAQKLVSAYEKQRPSDTKTMILDTALVKQLYDAGEAVHLALGAMEDGKTVVVVSVGEKLYLLPCPPICPN